MGVFSIIETFIFFSLAISFVLILLLIYHFKGRMAKLEQKTDTMVGIINDIAKELGNKANIGGSSTNTAMEGDSNQEEHCDVNMCMGQSPMMGGMPFPMGMPMSFMMNIDPFSGVMGMSGPPPTSQPMESSQVEEVNENADDDDDDTDDEDSVDSEDEVRETPLAPQESYNKILVPDMSAIDESLSIPVIDIDAEEIREPEPEQEQESDPLEVFRKMHLPELRHEIVSRGLAKERDVAKMKKTELLQLLEKPV